MPYYLVDIEVCLKPGCHDIMLEGRVGVVTNISGKIATVQIRNNSSDITIPHESLVPVRPRQSDTVKVIRGSESMLGLIGTMVSIIGTDGVVQFISLNSQRKKNPAQIPIAYLGRYTPKSRFAPGGALPGSAQRVGGSDGGVSPSGSGGGGGGGGGVSGGVTMGLPLQFFSLPNGRVASFGPYFTPSSSSSTSLASPFASSSPPTFTSPFPSSSSLSPFIFSSSLIAPSTPSPSLSRYFSSGTTFRAASEQNGLSKDSASSSRFVPVLKTNSSSSSSSSSAVPMSIGEGAKSYFAYSNFQQPSSKSNAGSNFSDNSARTVPGELKESRNSFFDVLGLRTGQVVGRGSGGGAGVGSANGSARSGWRLRDSDDDNPFLFRRVGVEQDAPESTTSSAAPLAAGAIEKDTACMSALPFAHKYIPAAAASTNHPPTSTTTLNSSKVPRSSTDILRKLPFCLSRAGTVDRPTGQVFTFPVALSGQTLTANQKVQLFLASQGSLVKGRGGGVVGEKGVAGLEGSDASNGYSVSEVLEKLVKNQRSYSYELASPTTPGIMHACMYVCMYEAPIS